MKMMRIMVVVALMVEGLVIMMMKWRACAATDHRTSSVSTPTSQWSALLVRYIVNKDPQEGI